MLWDGRFLVRHGGIVLQFNRKLLANGFLSGMGGIVLHLNRKLFADSFLSGMETLCLNSIGNYLRMVSCSAWG